MVAKHLEPLKGGKVDLQVLIRGKDGEHNLDLFRTITKAIIGAGVSHFILSIFPVETNRRYLSEQAGNPT